MKRNRDAIAQMAIYDLLCVINRNVHDAHICVMDAIAGKHDCGEFYKVDTVTGDDYSDCAACIQAFLNEEYNGRW